MILRRTYYITLIFYVLLSFNQQLIAIQLHKKLDYTGFLRARFWHIYSQISALYHEPLTNDSYQTIYQDLLSKNRLTLSIIPQVKITFILDIFTIFGARSEGDINLLGGSLGSPGINFVTRDLFAKIKPTNNINITLGLQPFSLPEGYILARDGAGVLYEHTVQPQYLNYYVFWIKALANSQTDVNEDGFGDVNITEEDVLGIGNTFLLNSNIRYNLYYAYQFNKKIDLTLLNSGWLGMRLVWFYKNLYFNLHAIFNHNYNHSSKLHGIAGLGVFSIMYTIFDYDLSLGYYSASGNLNKKNSQGWFHTIGHSSGQSYIFVDDTGGISLRQRGLFSGMYVFFFKFDGTAWNNLFYKVTYTHYQSFVETQYLSHRSHVLGDELNLRLEYILWNSLKIYTKIGVLFAGQGYLNLVRHLSKKNLYEMELGCRIDY